jgi:uncharacterized membrane protein
MKVSFWYLTFAHHPFSELNRTLQFRLFGRHMVLCTRCTGQYAAFAAALLLALIGRWDLGVVIPYLLPLPATLDWLTQALKLRESTTWLRLATGGLFGTWLANAVLALIAWDTGALLHTLIQIFGYVSAVMLVFALIKGSMDAYLKPYEDFVEEFRKQKKLESCS